MMRSANTLLAATLFTVSTSAFALNEGFETGTTTHHLVTVPSGGSAEVVNYFENYLPAEGGHFLLLKTNGPGSYTTARQAYKLKAGDRLTGFAAFASRDYLPYNDNAQVRIRYGLNIVATPFSADVASTGTNVDGPWTPWSYTAPADGLYIVEYRIANEGDSGVDSYALFDARELALDIKPGDAKNEVNPKSGFPLPVAMLGGIASHVYDVDRSTLRFGATGRETSGPTFFKDLFDFGFGDDLVMLVQPNDTGITCSTRIAYVTAKLYNGDLISGSDSVKPVGSSCD